jgi:hypothetical protein
MQRVSNRTVLLLLILGVWILPFAGALLARAAETGNIKRPYTITVGFQPGGTGAPDLVTGQAPPNTELAVYLNDRLLDVTRSNNQGEYAVDMPVMPQRNNDVVTLPTALDSSTLPLLYDVYGFESAHLQPADILVSEPFLAAVMRGPNGLQLYGSVTPFTHVEVFADSCGSGNAPVTASVDEEGGFFAEMKCDANASLPGTYCFRVAPEQDPSAVKEFRVDAPAQSLARGEGVWKRNIQLKLTPTNVSLTFSVEMPERTLVYQNLASGGMSERQFIAYVFGDVTLNTFLDPRKLAWRQEKQPNSNRVTVFIESQPLTFLIPEDAETTFKLDRSGFERTSVPPYTQTDTLTTTLEGVRVLENSPTATSGDAASQTWRGTLAGTNSLTLRVSRSPVPPSDPIGRARLLDQIAAIMTNLRITPPPLLRDTLEGQIVGLLPARAPAAEQALVFDFFSKIYRADPFTAQTTAPQTFQSALRDLPGQLPNWLSGLLFGAMWLIPAALTLFAMRGESSSATSTVRGDLAWIAAGAIALTLLGLDWSSVLAQLSPEQRVNLLDLGIGRATYLNWILAGHAVFILLFLPLPRWTRWLLSLRSIALFMVALVSAVVFTALARLALIVIPDGWLSALLTGLPLLSFAVLAWQAGQVGKGDKAGAPSWGVTIFALVVIFAFSLPVQSLPLGTRLGGIGVTTQGGALTRPLVSLALLIGVVVALRTTFDRPLGGVLKPLERGLGRVIMVGFAIGLTPAWGFVPLSIIGGIFLFEWVLPRKLLSPAQAVADFVKNNHELGVKQMLGFNRRTRLWRTAMSGAQKQVRENKMEDAEYQKKQETYDQEKQTMESPEYLGTNQLTLRDLAFNFGAGPRHRDNLDQSLAWGLILASPLVILEGWPLFISEVNAAGAFPFLSTGVRLIALVAQYLSIAAFLGYFFPYMRGRSGLEKGGWLAGSIVLAFLPYYLILNSTTIEWMVAAISAASILAFSLIVSLMAFDIRTLLYYKFGWFHLPDLYDFSELAAYLTGTGAPLVTTIVTAFNNKLNEWVPALLNVVFPSFTLGSSQFQLLQMLIDLIKRIT